MCIYIVSKNQDRFHKEIFRKSHLFEAVLSREGVMRSRSISKILASIISKSSCATCKFFSIHLFNQLLAIN